MKYLYNTQTKLFLRKCSRVAHTTNVVCLVINVITDLMHPALTLFTLYPIKCVLVFTRWVFLQTKCTHLDLHVKLFFFVQKKRFCFSYSLLGGNNCVFRYWWSDPMTDNPLDTDIADRMCFNVVFMVSFVGALWINLLNSAIWLSAYVLRSASCLLSWSCLSCWIILDNSSRFFSMSLSLVVSSSVPGNSKSAAVVFG